MSVTNPYSSDNRRYTSAQDEPAADLPQSSPGNPPESCITSIGRTTQATPHACSNMPQHFLMPADCSGAAVICAAPHCIVMKDCQVCMVPHNLVPVQCWSGGPHRPKDIAICRRAGHATSHSSATGHLVALGRPPSHL